MGPGWLHLSGWLSRLEYAMPKSYAETLVPICQKKSVPGKGTLT